MEEIELAAVHDLLNPLSTGTLHFKDKALKIVEAKVGAAPAKPSARHTC